MAITASRKRYPKTTRTSAPASNDDSETAKDREADRFWHDATLVEEAPPPADGDGMAAAEGSAAS